MSGPARYSDAQLLAQIYRRTEQAGDCLIFTGAARNTLQPRHQQYGAVRAFGKTYLAHRVVYFLTHGTWPQVVMHTCDTPRCVSPDHLRAGTQHDNVLDALSKGRPFGRRREAN